MRDIEFVHDEPDGPPPSASPEPPDRRAVGYRLTAAAVAVTALVVWALTRSDSTGNERAGGTTTVTATPTPTPTPSPSDTKINIVCRTGAPVANDIADAMRHYFPTMVLRNLSAYRCVSSAGPDGRIVFEAISARLGTINIDVETTLRGNTAAAVGASPQVGSENHRLVLLGRTEAIAVGLQVDVIAYGRSGHPAPLNRMRELGDFISLNVIL